MALAIADWTRKLPAQMRDEPDRILLEAATAGASTDDPATVAVRDRDVAGAAAGRR